MNISNLEVRKMASAFIAAVLSFFVVGLGQVYNGQLLKGIFLLMLATLLVITTGPFLVWAVWLAGIIDAHRVASHKVTIEKSTLKAMKMVE
jgi:TM2 domain-containing membrane protein YozV